MQLILSALTRWQAIGQGDTICLAAWTLLDMRQETPTWIFQFVYTGPKRRRVLTLENVLIGKLSFLGRFVHGNLVFCKILLCLAITYSSCAGFSVLWSEIDYYIILFVEYKLTMVFNTVVQSIQIYVFFSPFSAPTSQSACFLWPPTRMDSRQRTLSGSASGWRRRPLTSDMGRPTLKASDMQCLVLAILSMLATIIR